MDKLLVGLGNPGKKYEETRHNIGFMVADCFVRAVGASNWKRVSRSDVAEVRLEGFRVWVVMPQTFMNVLGPEVAYFASYYKIPPSDIVAVHDDLDLNVGAIRIKSGGGDGGHNGIKSITAALGTKDYIRVKVGIGRPVGSPDDSDEIRASRVTSWVLGRFSGEERSIVEGSVNRAADGCRSIFEVGLVAAQQKFNG